MLKVVVVVVAGGGGNNQNEIFMEGKHTVQRMSWHVEQVVDNIAGFYLINNPFL